MTRGSGETDVRGGPAVAGRVGAAVVLAAVLGVAGAPSPLAAQEETQHRPGRAGWLGVGLRQSVRCEASVEARRDGPGARSQKARCRRAVVAEAVVEGAPAERAGLEPGDTLVAVNGRALSRESGRDELGALAPGRPAQLLIGRPGEGRISLQVVPGSRPRRLTPGRVRTAEGLEAPEAPVVVSPGAHGMSDGGAGPVRGSGGRRRGTEGSGAVVIGSDDRGRIYVRWGSGDSVAASALREMGPRLEAIRDSVLAQARRHLRALREHHLRALREARERIRERARRGGAVAEAVEEAAPATPLPAGSGTFRAAGAEFRPLTPALSEYFPGAGRGLLVLEVVAGTPAHELGLRPGDVVVEAAGRPVPGPADLREALGEYPGQDSLVVKWVRKGKEATGVLRRR